MNRKQLGGEFALLITALIWGSAFAFQKNGSDLLPPAVFTAGRSFLGALFLIPVLAVLDSIRKQPVSVWGGLKTRAERKTLLLGGLSCGTIMFFATFLQQYGIHYTTAGKAGFLTALYIVMVPVAGLFFHRKTSKLLWCGVAAALAGSYLLNSPEKGVQLCDIILLVSAVLYTLHILVIDYFAPKTDCTRMACMQFFVCGVLSAFASFALRETWDLPQFYRAAVPVLYCGIGASGISYTLQIVGQKYLHPVTASLLMSLESVFSVLGGWLILNERLSPRELLGCAVIFCGILLVQIPVKPKS